MFGFFDFFEDLVDRLSELVEVSSCVGEVFGEGYIEVGSKLFDVNQEGVPLFV